ncbi:unnamed protein product [Lampetra fluviatilis]
MGVGPRVPQSRLRATQGPGPDKDGGTRGLGPYSFHSVFDLQLVKQPRVLSRITLYTPPADVAESTYPIRPITGRWLRSSFPHLVSARLNTHAAPPVIPHSRRARPHHAHIACPTPHLVPPRDPSLSAHVNTTTTYAWQC